MINLRPTFCHKVTAGNKVINRNNFGVALVVPSAPFDYMHAGCYIRDAEWCKPFDVYKWTGVQAKLEGEVKDNTDLCRTKTCSSSLFS